MRSQTVIGSLLALLLVAVSSARADEASGFPQQTRVQSAERMQIGGGISLGAGIAASIAGGVLIALPMADRLGESYQIDSETASAYTTGGIVSAVVGAALITTGVTLLVMGTRRSRAARRWTACASGVELRF